MWSGRKTKNESRKEKKHDYFEDMPVQERCRHPEHEPPNMLVIPAGKRYRHVCPGCGRETIIHSSSPTL
jgi:hypothetical protein